MHILLTDMTVCPRCGPPFGLILLVDAMEGRRVARGALGCPNCRERYPIEAFKGDFTLGETVPREGEVSEEVALRLAALAGVTSPPAYLLMLGSAAAHAGVVAGLVPGVEVVAGALRPGAEAPGEYSRIEVARVLPFFPGRFAGVVLSGEAADALLEEGARVLHGSGRLVVQPLPHRARERVASAGLRVVAEDGATMVCVRA